MKHDARVFEIASQSRFRNKINWKYSGIFHVFGNFLVMLFCLFREGVTNVITMLWMIIKSRFNFELYTLFCTGFTTFSASKINRWKGEVSLLHWCFFLPEFSSPPPLPTLYTPATQAKAKLVESAVPKSIRYKNKWANGIFEQWEKQRVIKVPNVEECTRFIQRLRFPFGWVAGYIFDRDECLVFELLTFICQR